MDKNRIYNIDCMVGIKNITDNSVDLVIIDPPYEIKTNSNKINRNEISKAINKVSFELEKSNLINGYDLEILNELVRVMKDINIYIWCNGKQIPTYIDFFIKKYKCNMEVLIWNKLNPLPLYSNKYLSDKEYCLYFRKRGYCSPNNYNDAKTVISTNLNVKDKRMYLHPTIKPLEIIRKIVRNSSKEDDLVLDCFLGSGTTAVACILEKRNYIGFEINKEYYDIANKRINEAKESICQKN